MKNMDSNRYLKNLEEKIYDPEILWNYEKHVIEKIPDIYKNNNGYNNVDNFKDFNKILNEINNGNICFEYHSGKYKTLKRVLKSSDEKYIIIKLSKKPITEL